MPSGKKISGVCHDIAHHAVSGLSALQPHVKRACVVTGTRTLLVDLCFEDPCPDEYKQFIRLHTALNSLRLKFIDILNCTGFSISELKQAVLLFECPVSDDDYSMNCCAKIVLADERSYVFCVDTLGGTIQLTSDNKALLSTFTRSAIS